jgi:hypothetical protein
MSIAKDLTGSVAKLIAKVADEYFKQGRGYERNRIVSILRLRGDSTPGDILEKMIYKEKLDLKIKGDPFDPKKLLTTKNKNK